MFIAVEGVHFQANTLDTNDIQTIRGGSMYLEALATKLCTHLKQLDPKIVSFGSSRAILNCGSASADELERAYYDFRQKPPWCFMSLRHGVGEDAKLALRPIRGKIYKDWTVPPIFPQIAAVPDRLDMTRAGTEPAIGPDGKERFLSPRNVLFRKLGGSTRPEFHLPPPQSFEQIVQPPVKPLAMQAAGKLALVYADGSGFGELGDAIRSVKGAAGFSEFLQNRRASLAARLEGWLCEQGDLGVVDGRLRFDVLIWGGDDMTFVMPAWLLFSFLEVFFSEVDGWGQEYGVSVTHRVSAVVANHKTPVRRLRMLADNGQKLLKSVQPKKDPKSVFSVDVFESAAPPFDSLLSYRRAIYGPEYKTGEDAFLADDVSKAVSFMLDEVTSDGREDGMPLTQIHRLLEGLLDEEHICGENAESCLAEKAQAYWTRVRGDADKDLAAWKTGLGKPRSLPMVLAQVAQLFPYVEHKRSMAG